MKEQRAGGCNVAATNGGIQRSLTHRTCDERSLHLRSVAALGRQHQALTSVLRCLESLQLEQGCADMQAFVPWLLRQRLTMRGDRKLEVALQGRVCAAAVAAAALTHFGREVERRRGAARFCVDARRLFLLSTVINECLSRYHDPGATSTSLVIPKLEETCK